MDGAVRLQVKKVNLPRMSVYESMQGKREFPGAQGRQLKVKFSISGSLPSLTV